MPFRLLLFLLASLVTGSVGGANARAASQRADALVLLNSSDPRVSDFTRYIQPYLENFGVPYSVLDIATNPLTSAISSYALLIVGQRGLDTNRNCLTSAAENLLVNAVSNGLGLVSFDSDLSGFGTNRYSFLQAMLDLKFVNSSNVANVTLPATEAGGTMHFITALHGPNESFALKLPMASPGVLPATNTTVLALAGGQPLVLARQFGAGRIVQWASMDWMAFSILGPLKGLDDLVWRGMVWGARKPFVMRSMPHFVGFRIDDVGGPFWWVHSANDCGFKPMLALFINDISSTNIADLRSLVTNGVATASPHSFTSGNFIYFNHSAGAAYSDAAISNNLYTARQFHVANGIPMCKTVVPHYYEVGVNAFPGLLGWGMEFFPINVVPGQIEYVSSGTGGPWISAGPYRLYEPAQQAQLAQPLYYSDWLTVPTHPELSNTIFNCCTDIRDVASCAEFCPDNDVAGTISRGAKILTRALGGGVLACLFTHEWYIHSVFSVPQSNPISQANWRAEMQGITNAIAAYNPVYVHLDYGNQYARALRTSRLVTASFDSDSGAVSTVSAGRCDTPLQVQVYTDGYNGITASVGTVSAFTNTSYTNVAFTLMPGVVSSPPIITSQPCGTTNHEGVAISLSVGVAGGSPAFQWYRNSSALVHGTGPTVALNGTISDAGTYTVIVTNQSGSVTSAPAVVALAPPLRISSVFLSSNSAAVGWASVPGNSYTLQYKDFLLQTNWNSAGSVVPTGSDATVTNLLNGATQRFFRVQLN